MSTIEKAVQKLERGQAEQIPAPAPAHPGADTLEKVVAGKVAVPGQEASTPVVAQEAAPEPQRVIEAQPVAATQQAGNVTLGSNARPEAKVGAPKLLELPFAHLSELGMVTPLAPRSRVAEELRAIKRPLLRNIDGLGAAPVANANLIMVTSALQGDGKTFNAINLAMSIAMEQDKTVLLVDADVSKASAGKLLGIPEGSLGLIDLLEEKGIEPADVICTTNVQNLRIMPAGKISERSTELLASQSMHELMLEMSNRYPDRVIVFDSPPLLLTSESSVLASFMGQIVFVVSTDVTPSEAITEALEKIGGDKVIGMVLNKVHSRRSKLFGLGSRYGYGYGYSYGYGYGRDSKRPPESAAQAG